MVQPAVPRCVFPLRDLNVEWRLVCAEVTLYRVDEEQEPSDRKRKRPAKTPAEKQTKCERRLVMSCDVMQTILADTLTLPSLVFLHKATAQCL